MTSIKDYPADVQEQISKAVYEYPDLWKGQVCAFQVIPLKKDVKVTRRDAASGDVCHAAVNQCPSQDVVVVNAHKSHWQNVNREFLLWATKESPFCHGVVNKDNDDELLNHAAVLDFNLIGKGGTLWVCKAVRHFEEDTFKLDFWNRLREQGLDGFQAFVGADILDPTGGARVGNTHVSLFHYTKPTQLRKWYDEIKNIGKIDTAVASRGGYLYFDNPAECPVWGSLKGKTEKVADGWGGFTEVVRPCDAKEYAMKLKEIFEGDPKNVEKNR